MLPFPFHFLNNNQAMNVRPKNYSWPDFYDRVIDLVRYSFSWRGIFRRFRATPGVVPRWMNVLRAVSTEGFGRLRYHREVRRRLDADPQFRPYFEQQTGELPRFYTDIVRADLGPLWPWLPEGALHHDPNAYLASQPGRPRAGRVAGGGWRADGVPSPATRHVPPASLPGRRRAVPLH